ncbi:MAG: helix-hairpin-helix domain-containing protein [Planctomycetota bacterium]|jgi:hypothetical protein|nr:helix-hairpin-helix domain-containing protein [Planctomycetota bacterium]
MTHEEAWTIVEQSSLLGHAHGDLDLVKKTLDGCKDLVDALNSVDYTLVDEIPQHAAAHCHEKEILEYMLKQGVELDIFMACALDRVHDVESFLELDPGLSNAKGAHGIPMLDHARDGDVRKAIFRAREKLIDPEKAYIDYRGRVRWYENDAVADELRAIGDLTVISGGDERIGTRCARAYRDVSRHPEPVSQVIRRANLIRTFALSKALAIMIEEYVEEGETTARKELEAQVPATVLELCEIPKVGGKTARTLFQDFGIESLAGLEKALDEGALDNVKGIGKKTKETMRSHIEAAKA